LHQRDLVNPCEINGLILADSATEYTTDSVVLTFGAAHHEKPAHTLVSNLLAIYASMTYIDP